MTFLNPMILLGLLAASLPVIFHLLNLRKLKIVDFSTLRFIKELQKTKIRKLKLKQILLLILRTLIIILAVFAFARPTIQSSLPVFGTYAKKSTVIIIDNSFSMDVSDELGNRFNQSKNITRSIIKSFKDGDEGVIITMSDKENGIHRNFSRNFNFLQEELSHIKISNTPANLEYSLRKASALLGESMNINREVFIITDAQPNIFKRELNDSLRMFGKNDAIYFIPVGLKAKSEIQNISVDSLNVITRIYQKDKLAEAEAIIRNSSGKDASGVVVSMFYNNERVAQRTLDVPANEARTVTLAAEPQKYGVNKARVEIESDALDADNRRYFGFVLPDKPNIALIGRAEKTKFINLIAGSNSKTASPANVREMNPGELSGADLSQFEMVICAGGPYRESDFQRLEQYVRNGGSVLIFADGETNRDIFKDGMAKLGFGELTERAFSAQQPGMFSSVDKLHPLFEGVFKGTTDSKAIVESPKIINALTCRGGQGLIEIPGGYFLSESRLGDGKVLYIAVPPDNVWSNFPVTGIFPTVIYRSIVYLSSKENFGANVTAGSTLTLNLPKKFSGGGNYKITDPNNKEYYKQAAILPSGSILEMNNLDFMGVFTVTSPQGKVVALVSVNPDPSESYLQSLQEKDILKAIKQRLNNEANVVIIDNSQNIMKNINRARTGTELWQLFIILALLCVVAEMLVAKNSKNDVASA